MHVAMFFVCPGCLRLLELTHNLESTWNLRVCMLLCVRERCVVNKTVCFNITEFNLLSPHNGHTSVTSCHLSHGCPEAGCTD